jgi:hypothetical protein
MNQTLFISEGLSPGTGMFKLCYDRLINSEDDPVLDYGARNKEFDKSCNVFKWR